MLVLHTVGRDEILFSVPHSHAPFGQSYQSFNMQLEQLVQNYRKAGLGAVNFGYIFVCRLPEAGSSTYYSRIVHSPTVGIHEEVSRYFRERGRLWGRAAVRGGCARQPVLHHLPARYGPVPRVAVDRKPAANLGRVREEPVLGLDRGLDLQGTT